MCCDYQIQKEDSPLLAESREALVVFEGETGCRHKCNEAVDTGEWIRKVRFVLPNENSDIVFTIAQTVSFKNISR